MRQPEPSVREHQTSNSTANAFLGGRRMPSWLTTGQPQTTASPLVPSRKRPAPKDPDPPRRPNKSTTRRPSSSASPHLYSVAAPAPPPPAPGVAVQIASNPASPALPNVVAPQAALVSSNADTNILPSPAPSEDPSANPPAPSKDPVGHRGRAVSIVSLGDDDEDDEGGRAHHRPGAATTPAHTRNASLDSAENSVRTSPPTAMQASGEREDGVAGTAREQPLRRPSAPASASLQSPVVDTSAQPVRRASLIAPAPSPRDPRPPFGHLGPVVSCLAPEFCSKKLQSMPCFPTNGIGPSAVERIRADLVKEAIERGDRDYLHFHQLMCLQAVSPSCLPPELAALPATMKSLDTLNHLVQTDQVSPPWLRWFADFPVPINMMQQQWPEEYGKQILQIRQFIALAPDGGWDKLQKTCFARKIPPTAVEIEREVGVHSAIFQSIFHRAILRRLCNFPEPNTPTEVEFFSRADEVFKTHQRRLAELRAPGPSRTALEELNRELDEERWYRVQMVTLHKLLLTQREETIMQRRMSQQIQTPPIQSANSPAQLQGQMGSPVQLSPMVRHPTPVNTSQQSTAPAQQMPHPQLQVAIPRARSGSAQMSPYGMVTPTSALQQPRLPSSRLVMNRQNFYEGAQQFQQPLQNGAQGAGFANGFNMVPHGNGQMVQNGPQGQSRSPTTPQFSPSGMQMPNGQTFHPGMSSSVYRQQGYQQGSPLSNDPHGSNRQMNQGQIRAHQLLQQQLLAQQVHQQQVHQQQIYPQQVYPQQMHPQQIVHGNAGSPPTPTQATGHVVHQVDPRQVNGTAASPVQLQPQQSRPFIPPSNFQPPAQLVDPSQSALHQAHVRSPILKATPRLELGQKLFQSVVAFTVSPTRLRNNEPQQKLTFTISSEDYRNLPLAVPADLCRPAMRHVTEESKMYRLRCARSRSTEEYDWILQDTYWPSGMFLTFNGQVLDIRKKMQFGKDLPVDITPHIQPGENQVEINLLRHPSEEKISNFAVAVEIIGIQRYENIKADCSSNRLIPAEEVLDSIKRGLSGSADDDDIAIVDSNITITLFDPFTSCPPCDIPVRGRRCLHRDCFDLGTFLSTRDRKQQDSPSSVDVWRCPICRGDARPRSLVVDGFLMEVNRQLSAMGQSDTRAIIVEANGNWKPKPEDKTDETPTSRNPSHSATPVISSKAPAASTPKSRYPSIVTKVIELE